MCARNLYLESRTRLTRRCAIAFACGVVVTLLMTPVSPPRLFGTGTNIDACRCPHDAWNRLVGVEYGQTVRESYVYNGLNWRIMKQADTDGTGGPDQQRLMHYSDGSRRMRDRLPC